MHKKEKVTMLNKKRQWSRSTENLVFVTEHLVWDLPLAKLVSLCKATATCEL